ncbi:hypothetical protein BGZ79_007955 [Entomortierella chlamydospora]|nr:hypothetical protein BGZ79_007955 [Entomortierella chlamydospora]
MAILRPAILVVGKKSSVMQSIPFALTVKLSSTYNDPTKKRGPPKGYIEAIEARLHRMEGLLGGLVKDKDPRAEIVRAELDAMAREAEMTGLKLRRSKAYEEISHVMNTYSQVNLEPAAQQSQQASSSLFDLSGTSSLIGQHHIHQKDARQRYPQSHHSVSGGSTPQQFVVPNQQISSVLSNQYSPSLNSSPTPDHGTAKQFNAQTIIQQQYLAQVQHDNSPPTAITPYTHARQKHPLHQHDTTSQVFHSNYSPAVYPSQSTNQPGVGSHGPEPGLSEPPLEGSRCFSFTDHHPAVISLTGYTPTSQGAMEHDISVALPPPNIMEHLLGIHFRFVHPVLPMLHQKTLFEQIHGNESIPLHLLFAVLGLASRFSESPDFRVPQPGSDRPPCTVFYERAKMLIKEEYDHSQIGTVQALLLMSIQQMGFCESQKAWLYVGMAIRMAQDLGLNRELSEQEQSRNQLSAELRKRTWWSCYVVERLVCAGLGRPLTITQQDCETSYPQYDVEDVDMVSGTATLGQPILISNFVHLITLSRIQGNILQFTKARAIRSDESGDGHSSSPSIGSVNGHGYRVDISQAAFFAHDRSLNEWRQTLPGQLQNPTAQSPHFGLFLHMTYNTLIILLHRPEFSSSATSASLCNQAAATITEITEILKKANALNSMFVSCLYSIFSAGLVHFMNIPSAKHATSSSSSASSTVKPTHTRSSSHATTAKSDLKRCIDALKHLSTHWVSAARRAKVLEDLLDLKHVSLKDLEEDTFKTPPLMPSWALEAQQYGKILAAPRENHDRLRQQCRSKIMAIQSLLATDDEFRNIQSRNGFGVEQTLVEERRVGIESHGLRLGTMEHTPTEDCAMDISSDFPGLSTTRAYDKENQSLTRVAYTPASSVIVPSAERQLAQFPLDADPMMLISTATFGAMDLPERREQNTGMTIIKPPIMQKPKDIISPMTLTTLGLGSTTGSNEVSGNVSRNGAAFLASATALSLPSGKQVSMLDPFSMPSSIIFPTQSHGRQTSCGGGTHGCSPQSNTVWSTDAQTHRAIARAAPLTLMSRSCSSSGAINAEETSKICNFHQLTLNVNLNENSCEEESDDFDLAWGDMPPTLGIDEWMAYIGALMMRWLASGQSSPRSTLSI